LTLLTFGCSSHDMTIKLWSFDPIAIIDQRSCSYFVSFFSECRISAHAWSATEFGGSLFMCWCN